MNSVDSSAKRPVLHASLFAAAWIALEYLFVGPLALAFVPLFTGGFILWRFTSTRMSTEPHRVIVPYMLTVIAFVAHVYEEYKAHLLGFPISFKELRSRSRSSGS